MFSISRSPAGRRSLLACASLALLWSAGAPATATTDGARLYERHCAACHGETGHGGVGVPLALPDFLAVATPRYLATTIRLGRPGRVMPAFTSLSAREVEAIVAYVRGFAGSRTPKVKVSQPHPGDSRHGAALFAEHCAHCHGEHGEGGRGTGVTFSRPRDLPIIAPALQNPGFLAAADDALIKTTLVHGRRGTPMVSFADHGLSDADLDDLVSYIRSFEREPPGPSSKLLETAGPVLVSESPYDLHETVTRVKRAVEGHNFRLIREQFLEQGLMPPGQEERHQIMVYFCNFQFLYEAMAIDPRVGLFLPCRITVLEQDGKVLVMSVDPRGLSALFNNSELNEACRQMHEAYQAIIEEATL